jgi:hypothetical protein
MAVGGIEDNFMIENNLQYMFYNTRRIGSRRRGRKAEWLKKKVHFSGLVFRHGAGRRKRMK